MPTLIPSIGAEEAPSTEVIYAALGSVLMTSSDTYVGGSSIDVLAESEYAGLSSIEPSAVQENAVQASIRPVNEDTYVSLASADVQAGDSFLILADILQEELSGPNLGSYAYQEIHAELLVDDVEIPIKSFQYQVPTGRLGSVLNIRLAEPDTSGVPAGASVKFSLKVRVGGVQSTFVLIEDGKLQQRDYTITYRGGKSAGPADEVSFSSLDVVADKFGLAPRRPVTMFDPRRIRYDTVQVRNDQLVRDKNGRGIVPVIEPCYGLSMRTILRRAYTGTGGFAFSSVISGGTSSSWGMFISTAGTDQIGCGFDGIITNIKDYKVRRADFELGSSWHDGAAPVVAMYAPIYFVRDNILYILDVDAPLPFGISAHTITLAEHKQLSEKIEYKPDTNAVLLTYQYDGNDPNEDPAKLSRDVFSEEVLDSTGTFPGTAGYSQTTVRRRDREFYMADAPDEVLDTLPLSSETENVATTVWYNTDGDITQVTTFVIHKETIDYLYEGDLLIQQTRNVYAAVADPGDNFNRSLFLVEREVTNISWTEDPNNAGVKLQSSVRTDVRGLCVYDPDVTETIDDGDVEFVRMIPVLLAQASGVITNNWVMNVGLIPTSSVRMTLHNMKGSQYNVEVVEIDHINNTLKRSYTEPTTGTVSNDPFESKSRTVLLRDLVSEAEIGPRVPISVNAYELPRKRALELGRRVMRRLTNPLKSLPITMAGVDFTIAQGSIVRGQTRDGYTSNYFVTGYSIDGSNLGKQGHRISQTIETTELPTVA